MSSSFILLALLTQSPKVDSELLTEIRNGHRETRSLIRTLQAEFELENLKFGKPLPSTRKSQKLRASWKQDGDQILSNNSYYYDEPSNKKAEDRFRKEVTAKSKDVITQLTDNETKGATDTEGAIVPLGQGYDAILGDPWTRALFNVLDKPKKSLLDLLDDERNLKSLTKDSQKGKVTYRIEFKPIDDQAVTVWIAPDKNYLVEKLLWSVDEGKLTKESVVLRFEEPAEGVFFPAEVDTTTYRNGKLELQTRTTFKTLSINTPLSSDTFKLQIPKGTLTFDHRDGTTFFSDGDNKPDDRGRTAMYLADDGPPQPTQMTASKLLLITTPVVLILVALLFVKARASVRTNP